MNIIIIARGYPSIDYPQWGLFEKDQALALQNLGYNVDILCIDGRFLRKRHKRGITKIYDSGIKVYNFYLVPLPIWFGLANTLKKVMIRKLFKKYLEENPTPDLIYTHYLPNSFLGIEIKHKYNIPVIAIEHWSKLNQNTLPRYIKRMGNVVYKNADIVLAVSNLLLNRIRFHFGVNGYVVYNLLGQEFINPKIQLHKNNKINFLAIGTLLPIKGFDILVDAFYKANLNIESWSLTIVGDGVERKRLEKQIKKYNLHSNIHLVGKKSKSEILKYLQRTDVFVLSSLMETFSVVCIEALSQGVPVIATACGGPDEFISKSDGILVEPNSSESLKDAILYMISHYNAYNKLSISDNCIKRFAPPVIANQLSEIFQKTILK